MKVLAFSDHLSEASSGGAERVAAEVYQRLVRDHGVDLTVVTVLRQGQVPWSLPGVEVVAVPGRDMSRVVGAELLVGRGLGRTARHVHARVRPDVLHGNGLHFHGTAVAARLSRRTGTPLVTTAHLADLSAMAPLMRMAGNVWDATLGRYALARSTHAVAVSEAVRSHLVSLGADRADVTVAPNGVDHGRFHARERSGHDATTPLRVTFVGRLIANKGPVIALDAVAQARDCGGDLRLTVLGDGPLRDSLVQRAERLGIASSVDFRGQVADVSAWLRDTDVLVRPSLTEGMPLAVLEAMACGVPVICSQVSGNTEVVTHGVNGLYVPASDTVALSDALVELTNDRQRVHQLGTAAQRTAAGYTWERSAAVHAGALTAAARVSDTEVNAWHRSG